MLVDRLQTSPSLAALLHSIQLVKLDGHKAHVAPVAGEEQLAGYLKHEHRSAKLAEALGDIVGRPMKLVFETEPTTPSEPATDTTGPADAVERASEMSATPDSPKPQSKSTQPAAPPVNIEEARNLPLVNAALKVFPNATVLGVFRETDPLAETDKSSPHEQKQPEADTDKTDEEDEPQE